MNEGHAKGKKPGRCQTDREAVKVRYADLRKVISPEVKVDKEKQVNVSLQS